jgi:hypothetical protein
MPRIDCQLKVTFVLIDAVLAEKIEFVGVDKVVGRIDENIRMGCIMDGATRGKARWNRILVTIV